MINIEDIQSLTDFKRNTARYLKKIKRSKSPVVLTVNGKAELVVQDAKAYQEMLEGACYELVNNSLSRFL